MAEKQPSKMEKESFLQLKEIFSIEKALQTARFHFTFVCLHKIRKMNPSENFVFSPYSIYDILLLIYFGSKGAIEELLKEILYLSNIDFSKQDLIEYYSIRKDCQSQNKPSSSTRDDSNCWITNNRCLILTTLQRIFKDRLETCDFHNNTLQLMHRINKTIEDAEGTNSRIKLIDVINREVELVLTTVVRFDRSHFEYLTEPEPSPEPEEKSFFDRFRYIYESSSESASEPDEPKVSPKKFPPDLLKRKTYADPTLCVQVSEFSYENSRTSLFVVLPLYYGNTCSEPARIKNRSQSDSDIRRWVISFLIERMSKKDGIRRMSDLLYGLGMKQKYHNYMIKPMFELEKQLPIHKVLEALGGKELIQDTSINMGGFIAEENKNMHLGHVVHRTYVKVTPRETVASAVTAVYTGLSVHPLDRHQSIGDQINSLQTFIWLIFDKSRHDIIFMGVFNKPSILPKSLYITEKYLDGRKTYV
ncbi:serine protease inhibitor 88Ea-like isoform X1 [Anoplolepis gracilipes]|uniref:serine protease inhibitor 88Ea-like isoform X1 n=1 Tax=Anoplolepis gracilipes TaxID=354296 RepID=UPI003BA38C10